MGIGAGIAGLNAVGGLISGFNQSRQLENAARAQQQGINQARGFQNTGFDEAAGFQQPFQQRGGQAFQTLADLAQQGVAQQPQQLQATQSNFRGDIPELQQFSAQDIQSDPGIQFAQEQAQRAGLAAAGAQGRRFSGGTLRELQRNAAGLAGQQSQQAFNRFATQQQMGQQRGLGLANIGLQGSRQLFNQNLLGRQQQVGEQQQAFGNLQGISNVGFNAAGNLGNLATARGGTLADLSQQSGNVSAARAMGQGQIFGDTLTGFTNTVGSGAAQFFGGS